MASDSELKSAIERTKTQIVELMRRVPDSVNSGSHTTAVAYKEACKQANKLLASKSPKYSALQQIANHLAGYK